MKKHIPSILAAWISAFSVIGACPAGYESRAALAQSARLILEVKVQAVMAAPAPDPSQRHILAARDPAPVENAQAEVLVTDTIRGTCKVEKFTLIGGPYATCSPRPSYVQFKEGQTLYLLLDRPLPDDTKQLVITWRGRPFSGTRAELDTLLQRTDAQRVSMLDRHRRLFSDAVAGAEKILPDAQAAHPFQPSADLSYPVLASLRLLLCDPAHFRPSEYVPDDNPGSIDLQESQATHPPPPGTYRTAATTTPWQCKALDAALDARARSHPKEVIDFHRRLLQACLIDEVGTKEALAKTIAASPAIRPLLSKVQKSALAFDLDLRDLERRDEDTVPARIRTASYLLIIADEADDRAVWRFFGFGMDKAPALDAELFLPLVQKRPESFSESWSSMSLLLAIPDPRLSPSVKDMMRKTGNTSRLSSFFSYFATLAEEATCLEVLKKFEQETDKELAAATDPERRTSTLGFAGYLVKKMAGISADRHLKSTAIQTALQQLQQQYPQEKASAAKDN